MYPPVVSVFPLLFTSVIFIISFVDFKEMLSDIVALHEKSTELNQYERSQTDNHTHHIRDEHIGDIHQLLEEPRSGASNIPHDNLSSNANSMTATHSFMQDERLGMLLMLLDTTHSTSSASSRNVLSIDDLTDAEFEELKSISIAQHIEFEDLLHRWLPSKNIVCK